MGADYTKVLGRRNFFTWLIAAAGALLINAGLFMIMPMLQHHHSNGRIPVEVVSDVTVTRFKQFRPEHVQQKDPQKVPEKTNDFLYPRMNPVSVPRPDHLEIPLNVDLNFLPDMQMPDTLPVAPLPEIAAAKAGIFSTWDLDYPVSIEVRVPPVYPLRARERGIEGWVKVRLLVDTEGRVERAEIVEAEPRGYFERSVLESVRKWKLTPPVAGGQAVKAWMVTRIKFRLE